VGIGFWGEGKRDLPHPRCVKISMASSPVRRWRQRIDRQTS
jgi:hypothetical protein